MGRSRVNSHLNDENETPRSRRKKNVSSRNAKAFSTETSEGKKAPYHCNYCTKDITETVHFKCATCPDFDLCVECFSVGAEVSPHKSNHPYRIMENLSFPLTCLDWNAEDEILLLEGMDMYGFWNWTEVAEHVGTKTQQQCIDHYTDVYVKSPLFPLPDMSPVVGKNRTELLAMAEDKKGASSMLAKLSFKEESGGSSGSPQPERGSKGKKPVSPKARVPSLVETSGYNSRRHEFDTEYDDEAEETLAEMEFKDSDTKAERELKLRMLHIYSWRLDERKRRKDFVLERNLLHPNPFERDLSAEERALCQRYDVYMRLHSKEEHEELLRTVISEHRTLKRIQQLKDAQAAGCRSSAEADRYLELKRRREVEKASSVFMASSSHANDFDIMRFKEVTLLSEAEKRLCTEARLPPPLYLKMQEVISREAFSGKVTKKADAHQCFMIDQRIVDRVYDMLVKKGLVLP